jgi:hypothetical protein
MSAEAAGGAAWPATMFGTDGPLAGADRPWRRPPNRSTVRSVALCGRLGARTRLGPALPAGPGWLTSAGLPDSRRSSLSAERAAPLDSGCGACCMTCRGVRRLTRRHW